MTKSEEANDDDDNSNVVVAADIVVSISDAFDGGNIELVGQKRQQQQRQQQQSMDNIYVEEDCWIVELRIKPDPFSILEQTHHMQSFAFRVTPLRKDSNNNSKTKQQQQQQQYQQRRRPLRITFAIINAGDASYPQAWKGTTVCYASHLDEEEGDEEEDSVVGAAKRGGGSGGWQRNLGTHYDEKNKILSWTHTFFFDDITTTAVATTTTSSSSSRGGSIYFSYFPPYSYHRHLQLVARCAAHTTTATSTTNAVQVESVGQSLDGRDLDMIQVGTGPCVAWIIHRQHPGESQAEYYAEDY